MKQAESVPYSLIKLISLIMEGGNHDSKMAESTKKIATNIAQLIRFNSVKHTRKESTIQLRHSKKNEPPLPVLVGLMVHMKTRKKSLINRLASEGICITYDRVKSIQKNICNQICLDYQKLGIVCPSSLNNHVFTTGAMDNLDHNPTSSSYILH